MIHVFDRPNGSRLVMYPDNTTFRFKGDHPADIENAERVVLQALDRSLPFAYNTVKPQYALQYVRTYAVTKWIESGVVTPEGMGIEWETDQIHEYQRITIFDRTTRELFKRNFDKLYAALRLLFKAGYVKKYTLRPSEPRLRVVWYVDSPDERIEVQEIDYILPPDFGTHPHKRKWRYKYQEKQHAKQFDGMLNAMRKAYPLKPYGNGMLPGANDHDSGWYDGYASPQSLVEDSIHEGDIDADDFAAWQRERELLKQVRIERTSPSQYDNHERVSFYDPEAITEEQYLCNLLAIMWFTMKGKNIDIII